MELQSTKYIFSRRIKELLRKQGFYPIDRFEDVKKPGFWVWEYEATPAFMTAFLEIAGREDYNG